MPQIDGRLARGERTRAAILDSAVMLATEVGLDGLSLGQLADRLGVSKSGLFAHWRSKEELQLATIDRAREQWANAIVLPALKAPRGIRRLWALHDQRISFYRSGGAARRLLLRQRRVRVHRAPRGGARPAGRGAGRVAGADRAAGHRGGRGRRAAGHRRPGAARLRDRRDRRRHGPPGPAARPGDHPPLRTDGRPRPAARPRAPTPPCCRRPRDDRSAATTAPTVDYGHVEPVTVHFDDLDALGIVHNSRYAVLLERAITPYWAARRPLVRRRATHLPGRLPRRRRVRDHLPHADPGHRARSRCTSGWSGSARPARVYGFRFLSADGAVVHAEGRRAIVRARPRHAAPGAVDRGGPRGRRDAAAPAAARVGHGSVPEEVAHQLRALGLQHPGVDLGAVVEPAVPHHVPERADRAGLRLPGAEDHRGRPGPARALRRTSCTAPASPPACSRPAASPWPTAAARRSATISACAVGSPVSSRSLRPMASSAPSEAYTTAPTGTSASSRAGEAGDSRATSSARRIHASWRSQRPGCGVTPRAAPRPRRRSRSPGTPRPSRRPAACPRGRTAPAAGARRRRGRPAGRRRRPGRRPGRRPERSSSSTASSPGGSTASSISSAGASTSPSSSAPSRDSSANTESEPNTRRSSPSSRRRTTRYASSDSTKSSDRSASGSTSRSRSATSSTSAAPVRSSSAAAHPASPRTTAAAKYDTVPPNGSAALAAQPSHPGPMARICR